MRFDARLLARAWLSVANAASTDKEAPAAIYRSITIEEFVYGARLTATNRFMVLTSWVPESDSYFKPEPAMDEAPDRTVVAQDIDGRAKGLMGYLLSLVNKQGEDYIDGSIEVDLTFDARKPVGAESRGDVAFDGLEPTFTVISVPDTERVWLPIVETAPVAGIAWRTVTSKHVPESTDSIGLNPEFVERIGKVGKHADGVVIWSFGGAEAAALVEWPSSDPHVQGCVMPRRDLSAEYPDGFPEQERPDPAGYRDEACPACATAPVCLRHSTGLVLVGGSDVPSEDS
ncbi:hypothetical protein [Nocardioides sp. GY 10127]|uniref:hypothetical protein n=1 Tax=Nocardioides sp. GY 10127 TaxID=2569762 RepID=UPI0010A8B2DE|nr:hypothetical protein [Nocardioides sp. GY 10127]TIC78813.1 hypothetical protein E8D37_19140 [Nocardioides sp. GY 10127]